MTEGDNATGVAQPEYNPPVVHYGPTHATLEQQKPLMKLLKRMLLPRHPKTKRFTKPRHQRKNRKEKYF